MPRRTNSQLQSFSPHASVSIVLMRGSRDGLALVIQKVKAALGDACPSFIAAGLCGSTPAEAFFAGGQDRGRRRGSEKEAMPAVGLKRTSDKSLAFNFLLYEPLVRMVAARERAEEEEGEERRKGHLVSYETAFLTAFEETTC